LLGSTDQATDNMQNYNSSNRTQGIKTTQAIYLLDHVKSRLVALQTNMHAN